MVEMHGIEFRCSIIHVEHSKLGRNDGSYDVVLPEPESVLDVVHRIGTNWSTLSDTVLKSKEASIQHGLLQKGAHASGSGTHCAEAVYTTLVLQAEVGPGSNTSLISPIVRYMEIFDTVWSNAITQNWKQSKFRLFFSCEKARVLGPMTSVQTKSQVDWIVQDGKAASGKLSGVSQAELSCGATGACVAELAAISAERERRQTAAT